MKLGVSGQSLFEVVFAVGIMALILIGIVSLATRSVKNSSLSESNAVATKYVQDATEWIRSQRDSSWTNLSSRTGATPICLGSQPISWGGSCQISGNTFYSRRAYLTSVSATSIDARVEVYWTDSSGTHTVKSVTRFTDWNR